MTAGDTVSPELLEVLQCPLGRSRLAPEPGALICSCGLRFEVYNGIANMVLDEATLPPGVDSLAELDCPHASAKLKDD